MRDLTAQVTSSLLQFPEVTVEALKDAEITLDSVLCGKFSGGRSGLAWLACGPQLEVVNSVTGERLSAYCFSGVNEQPPTVRVLAFGDRKRLASGQVMYEDFKNCVKLYSLDLNGGIFPVRGQISSSKFLSFQIIEKFQNHVDREDSVNEVISPDSSVSILSWQVKIHGQEKPSTYLGVFDINRWYHAQMPDSLRPEEFHDCPYFALWSLDSVTSMTSPNHILDILVHERSLSRGVPPSYPPPEQFFNPSTYNFGAHCQTIYLLLDIMHYSPKTESLIDSFLTAFAVPWGLVKLIEGFWFLDHNDYENNRDPHLRERAVARNSLLDQYSKILPTVQRKQAGERATPYPLSSSVLREDLRPKALSAVTRQGNAGNVHRRATFNSKVLSKIGEVWLGKEQKTSISQYDRFLKTMQ
ncbi:hypothetical protein WISP_74808 [Willisornis vidua]|uniref:ELYS beta-propeller domain-containing protein n=1 Tax=Willisornis vidua TaxID=1566151 RepID=A0ABQ9DBQ8_9PASS|nr:hypothetical protein WISP_74808 [Willisornis vidua]